MSELENSITFCGSHKKYCDSKEISFNAELNAACIPFVCVSVSVSVYFLPLLFSLFSFFQLLGFLSKFVSATYFHRSPPMEYLKQAEVPVNSKNIQILTNNAALQVFVWRRPNVAKRFFFSFLPYTHHTRTHAYTHSLAICFSVVCRGLRSYSSPPNISSRRRTVQTLIN